MTFVLGEIFLDVGNKVADDSGHDGDGLEKKVSKDQNPLSSRVATYADGDILGSSEEPVDNDTHERGVETELGIELGEQGVGHALGNNDSADSDTGDQVTHEPLQVVVSDPVEEGEQRPDVLENFLAGGGQLHEPFCRCWLLLDEGV